MAAPIVHQRLTFAELRPQPDEVGAVMGYPAGALPEVVREAIEAVEARGEELWSIEGGCVLYPDARLVRETHCLEAGGLTFEVGKIVGGQLARSREVAVFLCTAGRGIEDLSREWMAGGDPFTGFVADSLGSLVVEAAVDRLQDALERNMAGRGLRITNRYSPGYCEWHVSEQQKLFRLLPPGYCGVTLTDTSLMRPIKTVSGFIGVGPEVRRAPYTCALCQVKDCLYGRRLTPDRAGSDGR